MGELQSDFGARSIATCRRSVLKTTKLNQQQGEEVEEAAAAIVFFCLFVYMYMYIILFLFWSNI